MGKMITPKYCTNKLIEKSNFLHFVLKNCWKNYFLGIF